MEKLLKISDKIRTTTQMKKQVETWKRLGEKVVFTNGCFDILHEGHVTYLAKAADKGSRLVVGLNTDASVRRQGKGPERPINPEHARALLIAALEFVDGVVLFDDDTPVTLIEELIPSVLVKGGDYAPEVSDPTDKKYIVGREIVLENGGHVETIDLVPGFSTTGIVNKLKK